jgi:membrane fusion protein (multidrug efflux system)
MRYSIVIMCLSLLFIISCTDNTQQTKSGSSDQQSQSEQKRPPKEVNVVTIKAQQISMTSELMGRVTAFKKAEIRPQVGGIIQSRTYEQGSRVERGEQLYQIDPALYEANYQSAKAGVQNAQAELKISEALQARYESLIKTNAISEQEYENAEADVAQAQAEVALAKASLQTAKINLNYTKVYAPISGYIGPSTVTIGALVTAQQTAALATIRQLDPIYVDLSQPALDAQHLQERLMSMRVTKPDTQFEVSIILDNTGTSYPHKGIMYAADVAVDENTGTIRLRSVFPNPNAALLPGMFVRATIDDAGSQKAIVVPQKAVSFQNDGSKWVWIVNQDNSVQKREVFTSTTHENNWVIQSGLSNGDVVVVEGTMTLKPGAKVTPVSLKEKRSNISNDNVSKANSSQKDDSQALTKNKEGA